MKFLGFTALILLLTYPIYSQESANKTSNYIEEELCFVNRGDTLYGKLVVPKTIRNKAPVIVFVHGSGPEDYSSSDNYRYLWEEFTKAGFACFSWDRPGVGLSQGNWFDISIDERANEVINAIKMLKLNSKVDTLNIGLWGISQAGWVIPKVACVISPAFVISVSAPVTTAFDQEIYRLRSELSKDGFSTNAIDSAINYTAAVRKAVLDGKEFAAFDSIQQLINEHKWSSYVLTGGKELYQYLNVILKDDHVPDLGCLKCPILSIWGENDLLVPPNSSADKYNEVMRNMGNIKARIEIIPDADHTLTYNTTGRRQETIERRNNYRDQPELIFARGYVELMVNWLKALNISD